jgi:hypothetical protein
MRQDNDRRALDVVILRVEPTSELQARSDIRKILPCHELGPDFLSLSVDLDELLDHERPRNRCEGADFFVDALDQPVRQRILTQVVVLRDRHQLVARCKPGMGLERQIAPQREEGREHCERYREHENRNTARQGRRKIDAASVPEIGGEALHESRVPFTNLPSSISSLRPARLA